MLRQSNHFFKSLIALCRVESIKPNCTLEYSTNIQSIMPRKRFFFFKYFNFPKNLAVAQACAKRWATIGRQPSGLLVGTRMLYGLLPVDYSESGKTGGQLVVPAVATHMGMFLGAHRKALTAV